MMELALIGLVPILFFLLAPIMMVVSEVAGHFTYRRMAARQRSANRVIASFIGRMRVAQLHLARRSRQLGGLSRKLQASNQELEQLNTLKTRFLSMAAHDMRTPLASIHGFAESLAANRQLSRPHQRAVTNIMTAAEQMNRLTGDLTDLAVIEAGKLTMEPAAFVVSEFLAEVLPQYALLASRRGLVLAEEGTELPIRLVADRFRVGQVLSNLLGNAIKFTPAGGRVSLRVRPAPDGVFFVVSDTGPGIDPKERDKVFLKFYQSRWTTNASRLGWGLGLSIAQEIIRAHGGEIGVESPGLGRGSKFWFFIPFGSKPRAPGRAAKAAALACAALALLGLRGGAQAQSLPLDDKNRFEKALEEKAESVVMKILGPNKAKVVLDASLDFTRTERFELTAGKGKEEDEKTGSPALFAWQNLSAQSAGPTEFLPGIPVGGSSPGMNPPQSYERKAGFAPSFVKRLSITLIFDKSVPAKARDEITPILQDILEFDPERDTMRIVEASFAPLWRTVWHSPDSFSMIIRYSLLTLMALITLSVVAFCFIKLANAMEAMASAQSDYGMDLSAEDQGGAGAQAALEAEEPGEGKKEEDEEETKDEDAIVIEVKDQQVSTLINLIRGESAENVALVVAHLADDRRKEVLAKLPRDIEAQVLVWLSEVRFVEPELVQAIKEEIERRLSTAVGGLDRVFAIIDAADPPAKKEMLEALKVSNPELAQAVRSRVLFLEDLIRLGSQDWALLMGRIRLEDWAVALKDAPSELRTILRGNMMPKTWAILEQTMGSIAFAPDRVAEAHTAILGEVWKMIQSGLIANPLDAASALPAPESAAEPEAVVAR
ncbi:MAG: hypothetical protein HY554_17495 [Elusimicrobia bacterium]|nr:hypothetical protein [Elusimicrobiota bacterium]